MHAVAHQVSHRPLCSHPLRPARLDATRAGFNETCEVHTYRADCAVIHTGSTPKFRDELVIACPSLSNPVHSIPSPRRRYLFSDELTWRSTLKAYGSSCSRPGPLALALRHIHRRRLRSKIPRIHTNRLIPQVRTNSTIPTLEASHHTA